jgi:hypothetical protein
MRRRRFKVEVQWTMTATVEVLARDLSDAIQSARDVPLPKDGEYLPDSFDVDEELTREQYEGG